jgi:hypothetical protein
LSSLPRSVIEDRLARVRRLVELFAQRLMKV